MPERPLIGVLRVFEWKSPAFQAASHLYLGFLVGGAIGVKAANWAYDLGLVGLAGLLTIVEVVCFAADHLPTH